MAEEPEQMLEQQGIAALRRFKKRRAEIAVGEQHGDATRQYRQGEQQQEYGDQHRPDKQRHLVQGHAGGTHIENGGDEIDGTEDR